MIKNARVSIKGKREEKSRKNERTGLGKQLKTTTKTDFEKVHSSLGEQIGRKGLGRNTTLAILYIAIMNK